MTFRLQTGRGWIKIALREIEVVGIRIKVIEREQIGINLIERKLMGIEQIRIKVIEIAKVIETEVKGIGIEPILEIGWKEIGLIGIGPGTETGNDLIGIEIKTEQRWIGKGTGQKGLIGTEIEPIGTDLIGRIGLIEIEVIGIKLIETEWIGRDGIETGIGQTGKRIEVIEKETGMIRTEIEMIEIGQTRGTGKGLRVKGEIGIKTGQTRTGWTKIGLIEIEVTGVELQRGIWIKMQTNIARR